jgi:hypothetical protein
LDGCTLIIFEGMRDHDIRVEEPYHR